jgi:hypothetical protein
VAVCRACGEANPPAARFCGRCGAGLGAASGTAPPATTPAAGRPSHDGPPAPDRAGHDGPSPTDRPRHDGPPATDGPRGPRTAPIGEPGPPAGQAGVTGTSPVEGPVLPDPEHSILRPPASSPPPPPSIRTRRAQQARRAAIAVAIVALVLWWFLGANGEDGDGRSLSLPAAGEVAAAFVHGDPVFVVHDEDGEARVLDAVDPHDPGERKVLAYCRDGNAFEDLRHGSRFTREGHWLAGPAPTGMAAYEIVARDDEQVTIGELGEPPAREDADLDGVVIGPSCTDRLPGVLVGEPDLDIADAVVLHDGPASDDDDRWYPAAGLAELLEEWSDLGDPDDAGS